jgi:YihY family inner membrane protein
MNRQDYLPPLKTQSTLSPLKWFWAVGSNSVYRFYWDDCFSRAAALAYNTLLALVPLIVLSFSWLDIFKVDIEQRKVALKTVLEQVLPPMENDQLRELQQQVFSHLEIFLQNVGTLNSLSFVILLLTAIALLNTIESAFNAVWRVSSHLNLFGKFRSFISFVFLGAVLIVLSIYWTTKFRLNGLDQLEYSWIFSYLFPICASWVALTLIYFNLPAAQVRLADAACGGIVGAVLFELTKFSFSYYVSLSTTYSTMYGVLASIPLFLFWLYLMWVVILFAAEISYHCGTIHILRGIEHYATSLGESGGVLGIQLLKSLATKFLSAQPLPTEGELAVETGTDPVLVRECLNVLSERGFISTADLRSHARAFLKSPENIKLDEIFQAFHRKNERNHERQFDSKELFLESFRQIARGSIGEKQVGDWTLKDLVLISEDHGNWKIE